MAADVFTIVLKGKGHHDEGEADSAISPGMAVEMAADGLYDQPAGAQAATLKNGLKIAKEDALQGKTVADAYADGDKLFFYSPLPGDHIHVLVKDAEDIDVGDKGVVEGGGSGLFVEAAGSESHFQVEFLEGPGAVSGNTLVRARVL